MSDISLHIANYRLKIKPLGGRAVRDMIRCAMCINEGERHIEQLLKNKTVLTRLYK